MAKLNKPAQKPKPVPGTSVPNYPSAVATVLLKMVDNGFTCLVVLGAVICFFAWVLGSDGLERILTRIVAERWFCLGGWLAAIAVFVIARRIFLWRERIFEKERELDGKESRQPELNLLEDGRAGDN